MSCELRARGWTEAEKRNDASRHKSHVNHVIRPADTVQVFAYLECETHEAVNPPLKKK